LSEVLGKNFPFLLVPGFPTPLQAPQAGGEHSDPYTTVAQRDMCARCAYLCAGVTDMSLVRQRHITVIW